MKKVFAFAVVSILLGMVVFYSATIPGRFSMRSTVPAGGGVILGLSFRDSQEHPSNRTLRLFWMNADRQVLDRRQTKIPFDRGLSIKWIANSSPRRFEIWQQQKKFMTWELRANALLCVAGNEYLAENSNPHAGQAEPLSASSIVIHTAPEK